MKTICLFALLNCFTAGHLCFAQAPIKWEGTAKKVNDHQYEVKIKGTIAPRWHVYAQKDTALGLEPLQITWNNGNNSQNVSATKGVDFKDPLFSNKDVKIIAGNQLDISVPVFINGNIPAFLKLTLKGFASNNDAFLPIEESKDIPLEGGTLSATDPVKLPGVNLKLPMSECGGISVTAKSSLWIIFIKGFGGGLLALLMPCLFPMIPVTVSFFTNKSRKRKEAVRNGMLYGISIFVIYLLASLPFHLLKGVDSQIFNNIATNPWVNISFFIIFILFALSLFGIFELNLPASFSNKAGAHSGIFFMALTLTIVSFSCTGPILGTLLVSSLSAQGNPWELTTGMGGFGLALALPFTLFALFPHWLHSLPKSGGWLDTLKKSLAFVELALSIKFLSNADLVEHWGILKREVFIGLWILIALSLALYLFGVFQRKKYSTLRIAHSGIRRQRYPGRYFFASLSLLFAIYLIPGVMQSGFSNLKLLSGFPPPLSYSIYGKTNLNATALEPAVINDYAQALRLAKVNKKPLLIDFTGWACVNCRKMEEQIWTVPEIKDLISRNFVLVSLYVDDRQKLPDSSCIHYRDHDILTVGDKWARFEAVNFGGASQPLYVILAPDEKLMNRPVGYTDARAYQEWLQCGLDAFQNQKTLAKK